MASARGTHDVSLTPPAFASVAPAPDSSGYKSPPRRKSMNPQGAAGASPASVRIAVPKAAASSRKLMMATSTRGDDEEKARRCPRLREECRRLSDNWKFAVLTTALTIYALFGDDCRLCATHRDLDVLFDIFTLLCILVFSFEIVVSSIGVDEYFLGFFFLLDTGSTATLILDLTWIGNAIFCSDGDSEGALRTGRAGRAGARASRTVRIIRLMRLAKLYKAYKASVEARKAKAKRMSAQDGPRASEMSMVGPGEGDEDLLSVEDPEDLDGRGGRDSVAALDTLSDPDKKEMPPPPPSKPSQADAETRVGKKLSDMTTRRVIILVLVMLFCMPQFTPSSNGIDEFLTSSNIGADVVYERWRQYCPVDANATAASSSLPWCLEKPLEGRNQLNRAWFEKVLLNFLYQHHRGDFAWQLYWVGASSAQLVKNGDSTMTTAQAEEQAKQHIGELLRLDQTKFLGPYQYPRDQWDSLFYDPSWDVGVVPLPQVVKDRLTEKWQERCGNFVGVPVQSEVKATTPTGCSTATELRCSEREFAAPLGLTDEEEKLFSILFTFDIRNTTRLEAGLSILQTIFICFAVGLGALSFTKDANELLLYPIERMIAKMETIKDNPLEAMRLGDLEYKREELETIQRKEELAQMGRCLKMIYRSKYMKKQKEPMETVMLEKTIIKLGGLLAIGFGEAGADIVGHSMLGSSTTALNAMMPGQKVDTIIGFVSIRHFLDATEVLREKVMLFVNQVGEIVHGCVDDYHGAPNKNTGDSFLVVWRLTGAPQERQTKLADMSIMSFVKIIAEVNKSRVLAVYRKHPGLLQRVKGFRVNLGFGLHAGWAIEGAMGSEFKIDAAYLSPNVQVTARLQGATASYGVSLLMSHNMVHSCSQELALLCRLIDHVSVRGSRHPLRIYTLDLDDRTLEVVPKAPELVSRNRFKMRQMREVRKNEKFQEDFNVWELFSYDEDLILMRDKYSKEFFHRFSMAYRNYEAGEWFAARDMLFTCHYSPKPDAGRFMVTREDEWPEDGPTVMLLTFMRNFAFEPPSDWLGYRPLPER